MKRKELGRLGEELAASYLRENGYEIIERNFNCRFGEIDIIAQKSGTIYFVEVRTIHPGMFSSPKETITRSKLKNFVKSIEVYLKLRRISLPYKTMFIGVTIQEGKALIEPLMDFVDLSFLT